MNQMYVEAADTGSYTSLMSKIRLRTITESIAASTTVCQFSIVFIAQQIPMCPFDNTLWERKACKKKARCDPSDTVLRTQLLLQGRAAEAGLMLLALIHLLTGSDSKRWKERRGLCFSGQRASRAAPTSKIDGSTRKLARISYDCTMI